MNKCPYMVEFTGTPEAGKTTTVHLLKNRLEKKGLSVAIVSEAAESLPKQVPKATWEAHLWMTFNAIQKIMEAYYSNSDIILIDRGVMDSYFFSFIHLKNGKCTLSEYEDFEQLKKIVKFLLPDFLFVFQVSPEKAIIRRGGEGRIVNKSYLEDYNTNLRDFFKMTEFSPALIVDTTEIEQEKVVDYLTTFIEESYNFSQNLKT